ncbi:uncharacterized protein LOC133420945 [Cololabis saira]|uniref:uncharacterized protein LOC133420945 n=1 Tax=Cololabis saira TaxID=129043 RepID=UPI002AD2B894|nr:uncharacterized protein LOC133420945 [Cololabis saira]
MQLSLLLLVCCGLGGLGVPRVPAAPAEGRAPPPSAVAAAVSGDGVLTCDVTPPVRGLQVEMLEWYHVSGGSERTAYVHRRNEDMRKDIADEFRGRTELGEDGSLKIRHLTPNDSGQYRCVVWRRSRAEASVSLRVFQVERLDVGVSRTADNQLLILCETRVRNLPPKPLPLMPLKLSLLDAGGKPLPLLDAGGKPLPLLDAGGKPLPLVPGSWVGADQVHSVRARFPPRGPPEGGMFTCRLQVPELDLVEDRRIRIADQFSPQAGPGPLSWTILVVSILLAVLVPVATVLGFKLGCNKGWQSNLEEFFRKTFKLGSGQAGELHPPHNMEASSWSDLVPGQT